MHVEYIWTGSEIALSWSPMRLKILHWWPEFHKISQKLDEDLDILWASKGGNVDLSKWSKDYFSTSLISIANILLTSPWRLIILACVSLQRKSSTNTFWWPHFSIWWLQEKFWSPVGACRKKLISDSCGVCLTYMYNL